MIVQHANDLAGKIQQLQADRRRHVEAMAAIDAVLEQIGAALRAAPANAADGMNAFEAPIDRVVRREVPQPRRRGRFEKTGIDSVLDFIREQGNPTTAEINAHWRHEGRKGTANVTLLKLLNDQQIQREQDATIRGSRYRLATSEASLTRTA